MKIPNSFGYLVCSCRRLSSVATSNGWRSPATIIFTYLDNGYGEWHGRQEDGSLTLSRRQIEEPD